MFDRIFASTAVEWIEKKSAHGLIPILLGALIIYEGHSKMFVRGLALFVCVLWLCLDIGVALRKSHWRLWKFVLFSVSFCFLSCIAMGIMYSFLESTLEDQQADAFKNLAARMYLPPSGNIYESIVTVTNGGNTAIGRHQLFCVVNRISFRGSGGIGTVAAGVATPSDQLLLPGGDAQSDVCLFVFRGFALAKCADLTATVEYSLETQPSITKRKQFRFVTREENGVIFGWFAQPTSAKEDYCPSINMRDNPIDAR